MSRTRNDWNEVLGPAVSERKSNLEEIMYIGLGGLLVLILILWLLGVI